MMSEGQATSEPLNTDPRCFIMFIVFVYSAIANILCMRVDGGPNIDKCRNCITYYIDL